MQRGEEPRLSGAREKEKEKKKTIHFRQSYGKIEIQNGKSCGFDPHGKD